MQILIISFLKTKKTPIKTSTIFMLLPSSKIAAKHLQNTSKCDTKAKREEEHKRPGHGQHRTSTDSSHWRFSPKACFESL